MKARVLLVVAGLLLACQPELPTASNPEAARVQLTASQTTGARIAINDALNRIVPRLSSTESAPIASSLTTLLASLSEGAVDRLALADALHQVKQFERTSASHTAELDVIRMALGTLQN